MSAVSRRLSTVCLPSLKADSSCPVLTHIFLNNFIVYKNVCFLSKANVLNLEQFVKKKLKCSFVFLAPHLSTIFVSWSKKQFPFFSPKEITKHFLSTFWVEVRASNRGRQISCFLEGQIYETACSCST